MIVNLTPHDVDIVDGPTIPSSGVCRLSVTTERVGSVDGIPAVRTVYGDVKGLPDPVDGTVFIVSSLVASRVPDRHDVAVPADFVRDDSGRILGCRSLSFN